MVAVIPAQAGIQSVNGEKLGSRLRENDEDIA